MQRKKRAANLRRALEELEGKGGSLDDLPTNREATDWNVMAAETSLGPLELVALKTHRGQQQQDGECSGCVRIIVFTMLFYY